MIITQIKWWFKKLSYDYNGDEEIIFYMSVYTINLNTIWIYDAAIVII